VFPHKNFKLNLPPCGIYTRDEQSHLFQALTPLLLRVWDSSPDSARFWNFNSDSC